MHLFSFETRKDFETMQSFFQDIPCKSTVYPSQDLLDSSLMWEWYEKNPSR